MTEHLTDGQRLGLAKWYWDEIDKAAANCPDDPTGGEVAQNYISAAITEGLIGLRVDVGDGVKVPLSELVAPYRPRAAGLAETSATARRVVLGEAMQRRRKL